MQPQVPDFVDGRRYGARARAGVSAALPIALAATLGACVPAPYGTYVRPSYPDPSSVVTRESCSGQAGPPTRLAFAAPGSVRIAVTSPRREVRADRPGWPLAITVSVPPGARFRFVEPHIRVAAADDDAGRPLAPDARVRMSLRLPADGWFDLARFGPTSAEIARQALARDPKQAIAKARLGLGALDRRAPQSVEVRLPAIETVSGRIELPPQQLQADAVRSTGYQALRSREHAGHIAEWHAACLRDKPHEACENILRFNTRSFEIESGPFVYSGRFWNFVARDAEPLRFELQLAARTAEPWRLPAPVVHVTDLASGERHAQRLTEMQVALDYPVPLSAPIEAASAELVIRAHLDETPRGRYLVRLPAYELDGARHALKPVELEVRRFDGGIEPFNC